MFATTVVTLIDDSAKLTRSTTSDGTDHLAVTKRNPLAKLLKVRRCVLPKAVRDGRHRLVAAVALVPVVAFVVVDASPKDPFNCLATIHLCGLSQVQVNHRCLQATVTEVLLDDSQADARFEQMGGVGMTQGIHTLLINSVVPESATASTRSLAAKCLWSVVFERTSRR